MASIDDILALVDAGADPEHLFADAVSADSPELFALGVDEHGSWEAAVAAALIYVRRTTAGDQRGPSTAPERDDVTRPERKVSPASHVALHVISKAGLLFSLDLDAFRATPQPVLRPFVEGPGREHGLAQFVPGTDDSGLVLITDRGNGLAVDSRLLPRWEPLAVARPLSARFSGVEADEVVGAALPRRSLRDADRLFTVSVLGQIKATDMVDYRKLSADAITATLMRDGDALFNAFPGGASSRVFVGSSAAKGLTFDTTDIRSQGRKATGVRAIGLDPDARVVGAFVVDGVEWMVLATEQGFLKRMWVDEFRPQGRGGGGLQTCRLGGGDHVVSMAPITLDGDVIVLTNRGRVARFPTYDLPFGGRAARGEQVLPLEPGEQVEQVIGVAAGNWA